MASEMSERESAELQRRVAALIALARAIAQAGAPGSGLSRLYDEMKQLAATLAIPESSGSGASQTPRTSTPRQRSAVVSGPAPVATDYWFG